MNRIIRKKVLLYLGLMLSFPFLAYSQKIEIKGCIVEESENSHTPIGYVNIDLLKSDSTFVSGTSCDDKGIFNLKGIEQGDYLLSASFMGYENTYVELKNLSNSIDLGNITIVASGIILDEVTISGATHLNRIDRKVIFPNEVQVKRSADGVDLLRNMHLRGIDIKISDNTISGIRGGRADLRINGVQVSEKELMGVNPKDIIRIEYHDEPSLRYGDAEIVVDYIVRRQESGGSVMANFQKGLPVDMANGYLSAKMNYKKSEFTLNGNISRSRLDESYRTNREVFNFQDGRSITRIEEGMPNEIKMDVYNIRLNYSYMEPDEHHFSVSAGYYQYHNPVYKTDALLYADGDRDNGVFMKEYHYSDTKRPTLNLYYQRNLKNKQLIVMDVTGTYTGSDVRRDYKEIKKDETLTDILSLTDGKKYSVIAEVYYEKIFDKGRLSTGAKHSQNFIKNKYSGNYVSNTEMNQSSTYFYADWMGRFNKFSYSIGIGGTQTHIKQGDIKFDEVRFSPSIRMGYQLNDHFDIRYRGQTGIQSPGLGDMNATEQAIDSLQIRRGNPLLKPVPYFLNRLTLSFNKKPVSASLDIYDHYSKHPIMGSIFEEDGKFIHIRENGKAWHQVYTTGYIKVSFLDGNLNTSVYGGLNWVNNWGDRFSHVMHNWFINTNIDYTWKNWTPFWEIYTRRKNLDGEFISYSSQATTLGIRYKVKNLSLTAMYTASIGYSSRRDNLSEYASARIRNYEPEFKNVFYARVQWNFEFGRKYKSGQKKLNNADNDAGVMSSGK